MYKWAKLIFSYKFNSADRVKTYCVLLFSSLFILSNYAYGQDALVLGDDKDEYLIGKYLEILEDTSGNLAIDDVTAPENSPRFIQSIESVPNFGFTDSAYWVKLKVENRSREKIDWVLELSYTNMHYIDFYFIPGSENRYNSVSTGILRHVETRHLPSHRFAFNFSVPTNSEGLIYVRFKSGGTITLPLMVFSQQEFNRRSVFIYFLIGSLCGFLFVMIIYNLMIFFSLRDKSYLYFAVSIFFFFLVEAALNGSGPYYLWPGFPEINNYVLPVALSLCIIAFLRFTSVFLDIRNRVPVLNRIFRVLQALWASIIIVNFSAGYSPAVMLGNILLGVSITVAAGTALNVYMQGYRPVRFYLAACLLFLASVLVHLAVRFDVVPSTLMLEHSYKFGVIIFMLMLAFALSDRYNLIKEESDRARRELHESEQKFSAIFDQTFELIGLLDAKGVLLEANETALQLFNLKEDDVIGKLFWETPWWTHSAELQDKLKAAIEKAAGGGFDRFEAFHPDPEGNIHALDFSIKPVKDDRGVVRFLIPEGRDITDLKHAEEELRSERDKLKTLIDGLAQVKIGVNILNCNFEILFQNQMLAERYGDKQGELCFQRYLGQDKPCDNCHMLKVMETKSPKKIEKSAIDGLTYEVYIAPLPEPDGNIEKIMEVLIDITERKKTEAALTEYRNQLEYLVDKRTSQLREAQAELVRNEKYTAIGRMASTVSHEMRNPLGTIRTTFYYIRELIRGQIPGLEQPFERVDRNITRCDNIVEELSEFTRVRNFNFVYTDIDEWLEIEINSYSFPGDVEIEKKFSSGLKIMLDHESLQKCLSNIIDNSVQAIGGEMLNKEIFENKEIEKKIRFESRVLNERLEIEICDSGGGIVADEIEQVFEPLYSTKGFGVGLGLPIVKQIIEQHGGGVDLTTEKGKWTSVVLWLPLGDRA